MSELQPCRGCRRHVRDARCPFCGAASSQRQPLDRGFGRMSRAMVFASATLTAAACGGKANKTSKPDEQEQERDMHGHHVDRPCSPRDPKEVEAARKKVEDAKTDEEKQAAEAELRRAETPLCAPYGAPPARRRVV